MTDKTAEEKLQQALLDKGLLKEIKKPIADLTPYQNRTPIVVHGKPLSETIAEDRDGFPAEDDS